MMIGLRLGASRVATILLVAVCCLGIVLGIGFLYGRRYADVQVYTIGIASADIAERVTVVFFDGEGEELARGHFRAGGGFFLDAAEQIGCSAATFVSDGAGFSPAEWHDCFDRQSRWVAQWAPRAKLLSIGYPGCPATLQPFTFRRSNDWILWWVPLPHVGGLSPRAYSIVVHVDPEPCSFKVQ